MTDRQKWLLQLRGDFCCISLAICPLWDNVLLISLWVPLLNQSPRVKVVEEV